MDSEQSWIKYAETKRFIKELIEENETLVNTVNNLMKERIELNKTIDYHIQNNKMLQRVQPYSKIEHERRQLIKDTKPKGEGHKKYSGKF